MLLLDDAFKDYLFVDLESYDISRTYLFSDAL